MFAVKSAADGGGAVISPNNLIQQMVRPENLIQQDAGIRICMPIEMEIKRPVGRQQAVHQCKALIEKIKVSIQIGPGILIAFGQYPFFGLTRVLAAANTSGIFAVCKKWGIGVDQIDAAFIFGQQSRHYG